jgi:arabinofuranosyltransferase
MTKYLTTINIFLIVAFGCIISYLSRNFHVDDALIYYRYVENFINGDGLVYNIGERFNALTSPLYIYFSILVSYFTGEVMFTQTILNGALLIASSITSVFIFKKLELPAVGFVFSLLLISSKYFYFVFGMETNLFIFLTLLTMYFYINKKIFALSISSVLLLLTRGEGIFLLLILLYFIFKEERKSIKVYYALPFIIGFGLLVSINYFYYGQIFPHTLTAKIAQGKSGLWGSNSFFLGVEYLKIMFNSQAFYILFLFTSAMIGLTISYKKRIVIILYLYSFFITIFYTALNVPNYHWYYSPLFLVFYLFVSFGVVKIIDMIKFNTIKLKLTSIFIILMLVYAGITHLEIARLLRNEKPHANYTFIGEWFRNNTPADTKIAAVEIGHIGWYSKRYIIDILGLTNPFNADFIGKRQFDKWFEFYKPDYIIIHEPNWGS